MDWKWGIALLLGELAVVAWSRRRTGTASGGTRGRPWIVASWLVGCAMGLAAAMVGWEIDEGWRALGFPVVAVLFERTEDGFWLDYVSPWSAWLLGLDLIMAALLPRAVVGLALLCLVRRDRGSDAVDTRRPSS